MQKNSIIINAQYIKDLSFESPKSPYTLVAEKSANIKVNLEITINKASENSYEVVVQTLVRSLTAKDEDIFVLDLQYAGLFTIEPQGEPLENILYVHCPIILFPYIRRIISDITRDGGFPPLMLTPVDFKGLYQQKKREKAQEVNIE